MTARWPRARRVIPPVPPELMNPSRWPDSVDWMRAALDFLEADPARRVPVYGDGDAVDIIRAGARLKLGKSLDCDCSMSDSCRCDPKMLDPAASVIPDEPSDLFVDGDSDGAA